MPCQRCGAPGVDATSACPHCGAPARGAAAGAAPFWLEGNGGLLAGQRFAVTAIGLTIGRDPACSIYLNDPEISRQQARVTLDAQSRVWLDDLSVNGSYVNQQRVRRRELKNGDELHFGLRTVHSLIFRQGVAPSIASRPPAVTASNNSSPGAAPAVSPAPGRAWLQLILDLYAVQDIPLPGGRIEIGSRPGPGGLPIPHPSVLPVQAVLQPTPNGGWKLQDANATPGTRVNGELVRERVLQDGDAIQLGICENRLLLFREPVRRALLLRDITLANTSTRLGRDPENDVRLQHPTVSRLHAIIHKSAAGLELEDCGSANGTFVNGVRIRRQRLNAGDRIMIGAVPLFFDGTQMEAQSDGTRFRLSCQGLGQTVTDAATGMARPLLEAISLVIQPRELVGILGPSGCGKSTLLDALNGLRPARHGQVQINTWDLYRDYAALRPLIGHVPQDDILHTELTVGECLYYAARLRLPGDTEESEIEARITEVLGILELRERRDTGIALLSGGQRKRVSLGIELLSKPGLLFLDEPTAGQDPRTEMKMMQTFREIANRGATVVLSTHLLGSFSLLDKVTVLVGGRLAYFGPGQELLAYFRQSRPSDIYDCLQQKTPEQWARQFQASRLYEDLISHRLSDSAPQDRSSVPSVAMEPESGEAQRRWSHLRALTRRQFRLRWHGAASLASLLAPPAVVALLVDWLKAGADGPKTLFMMVFAGLWFGGSASVRELVDERPIFRRERQHGLSLAGYLGAKLGYALGLGAVQTGVFVGILLLGGALHGHIVAAWAMLLIIYWNGALLGLLISALVKRAETALLLFPVTLIPQLLLAGLFIPVHALHPFYARVNAGNGQVQIISLPPEISPGGMNGPLRWGLSPLMASRWGLEGLADLYIHDGRPHSLRLADAISISLHPQDGAHLRAWISGLKTAPGDAPPSAMVVLGESAFAAYFGILLIFAAIMIAGITFALRWQSSRQGTHA